MVSHLAAFYNATTAAALAAIPPIGDDCLTTSGNDLTVPELNKIVAMVCAGAGAAQAQIQAPSLSNFSFG